MAAGQQNRCPFLMDLTSIAGLVVKTEDARYTVTDFSIGRSQHPPERSDKVIDSTDACACMRACSLRWLDGRWNNRISHQMSDGCSHPCMHFHSTSSCSPGRQPGVVRTTPTTTAIRNLNACMLLSLS